MPKLTKEQLANIKYVSVADLSSRLDQIESIEDKVDFATRYLLSHGIGETDCSFLEAVHVARMKVAEASLASKNKLYNDDILDIDPADYPIDDDPAIVDAIVEDSKDDQKNEMFMGDPIGYLKGKAKDLADEIEEKDIELGDERSLKENCIRLGQELNGLTKKDMLEVDRHSSALDMKVRLQAKFGNRDMASEIKPGIFSRMFGTSSGAASNLDAVYKAFNNPNHALYGDMKSLEKAANEYMMHRYPDWKPGQPLPSQEAIDRLSGAEKSRTELSAAIIVAAGEQKKTFDHFGQLVDRNMRKNFVYEDVEKPEKNEFQHNFQNQLGEDLVDEDESSIEEDDDLEYIKINDKSNENEEDLDVSDNMSVE